VARGFGCHGRVVVGSLPADVAQSLEALPGDWLEYDGTAQAIVVRHVQPTGGAIVPTVVSELVRMLALIPYDLQEQLAGGTLLAHTEDEGRLVRITVAPGGGLHVEWAHPDYAGAEKQPFDGHEIKIEGYEQRLNGQLTFRSADPQGAASGVQLFADTFEGLYPEGDFRAAADPELGSVTVTMRDVNLDVRVLIEKLRGMADPGSITGRVSLASFREAVPEHLLRLVFEGGEAWVQRPLLWE
jgi:hypothetical protein